jgi:hypothetical protein
VSSLKAKKEGKKRDYIDEWLERQEVVYKPSYHRGRVENLDTFPSGRLRMTGIIFNIIPSIFALIASCWMFYQYFVYKDLDSIGLGLILLIVALLGFRVGYRFIKEDKARKQNARMGQGRSSRKNRVN